MVGNMVRPVWLAAKGCQSSADRTFVLSQWQDLMNASPRTHRTRSTATTLRIGARARQPSASYWRSKTSLAFACPVSTTWIAELTSSSWRRS
jgi:hypothetical protein